MKKKKITIKDVAKDANVSVATVSAVINKTDFVSEKLTKKVNNSIKKLNYRLDAIARSLKKNSSNTIGLLVSNISNIFFAELIKGAEDYLVEHNYTLLVCNTDNDPKKERVHLDTLIKRRIDGLIATAISKENSKEIEGLINENVPVVFLDEKPICNSREIPTVTINNLFGTYEAVKHLIKHGHNRIVFFGIPKHLCTNKERFMGYKKALDESKIEINDQLIINSNVDNNSLLNAARDVLRKTKFPAAIFAASNMVSRSIIIAAKEMDIKIPEDVAVIGFGDFDMAPFIDPPLTVISIPNYKMGYKGAELLLGQINMKKKNDIEIRDIVIEGKLNIRKSCGC